jgi:1-deoxy-D-xylulose-5-phosphate synthase
MGGYGSIVLETFSEKGVSTPVIRIGWPDQFVEHASSVDYLRERHGLTAARVLEQVHKVAGAASTPVSRRLSAAS